MSSTQCAVAPPHGWRLFLVFVGFAGLVCLYTYPLILHPGTYLRTHGDPFMFTWALNRVAEGLFTDPLGLFETNIFYPYGKTLAYSEPLLVPAAVTAAPVYLLSGNPILAYNVTLLAFQALSGFSAYYAARSLTGSEAGGWLVGIAYALCAFKTGYYNFLTIHLSFAVPLALLYLIRFFEHQRPRDLWRVVGLVWLQTITIWYGGIPLVALLLVATLGFLLLRPGGWKPRSFVWMLAAGVVLILALLPIALPYMQVRSELGLERNLETVVTFRADLMSYLDAGQNNRVYELVRSGRYPGLFPGFTVYLLAAVAFLHLRRRGAVARAPRWLIRTLAVLGGLAGAAGAAAAIGFAANTGKLAFDSIVQRDAPDANQGRAFAGFETRFQLAWAVAAFTAVAIQVSGPVGFFIVGVVSGGTMINLTARSRRRGAAPRVSRRSLGRARGRAPRSRSASASRRAR